MASVFISEPGSQYGPCKESCKHTDCAESRRQVESICRFCSTQIGYHRMFCMDDTGKLVHTSCYEHSIAGGDETGTCHCKRKIVYRGGKWEHLNGRTYAHTPRPKV